MNQESFLCFSFLRSAVKIRHYATWKRKIIIKIERKERKKFFTSSKLFSTLGETWKSFVGILTVFSIKIEKKKKERRREEEESSLANVRAEMEKRTFYSSTCRYFMVLLCLFLPFAGKFKEQASSNSAWLPVLNSKVPEPRPGTCVNDTASLPDSVLNFIRSHPLMDKAVNHEHNNPVFYKRDLVFTKLVVDK